ncbi:MAG: hypothetical protein RIQ60_3577 [Pseudomonadota bacterium]|jgi:hypothetical protein
MRSSIERGELRRPSTAGSEPAGPLMAECSGGGQAVPLAWLPDVVTHCTETRPGRVALQHLSTALMGRPGLALFELQRDAWAWPVTEEKVWREARTASPEHWAWVDNRWNPDGSMRRAVLRELDSGFGRRLIPAVTAQTELQGVPGALALMAELTESGQPVVGLLRQPVFRLAILASDAAELFGYGAAPVASPAPKVPLRLVSVAADDIASPADDSPPAAASAWKDEKGQWLPSTVDDWRKLRAAGMTDAKIAQRYGVTRGVITGKLKSKTAGKVASQGHKVSSKATR